MSIPYRLLPLPYAFDALEPYIDARTMEIHYTKHHQAYLDNLLKALATIPNGQDRALEDILRTTDELPAAIRTTVINNGGGHYNHTLFWTMLSPAQGQAPKGPVVDEITKLYGSFAAFQEQFNAAATSRFGSGWAWLVINQQGKLEIISRPNQDSPIMDGHYPLLGLDVWEHAYYLKYQNKRVDYIKAWWNVINWDTVAERYTHVAG
jgi:Fe-Mn family superoxide dismutase